jgi:UDP-N-acetylmuramate--alanine ligase
MKSPQAYLIGIKGVGMTMLAQFLAKSGYQISGSDNVEEFMTDQVLRQAKIKVKAPFSPDNIPTGVDLIIYSSAGNASNNSELAYIENHPEKFAGVRVITYAVALGELFNKYYGLAVCGSHGKTTTSAWLGYVLWRSGRQPNVLVGSRVPQFRGSSLRGASRYFVAEVDEYQNKLQYFKPQGVILNNIDYDYPDFFKTPADYNQVFVDFVKKIPDKGFLIFNEADSICRKIKKYCRGRSIGYSLARDFGRSRSDYIAYDERVDHKYQYFSLRYQGRPQGEFKIKLWGEHNIYNALAVIAAARQLRVSWADIKRHLAGFQGTERRAQVIGTYKESLIIDDYAHHPTEIKATLAGLRKRYAGQRIITVFHPHTFTRTKALFQDFVSSFSQTDELIILDIYGSAREKQGGVSSAELAQAIKKRNEMARYAQKVRHIKTMPQVVNYLRKILKSDDLVVLMGAGDVFRIGQYLIK